MPIYICNKLLKLIYLQLVVIVHVFENIDIVHHKTTIKKKKKKKTKKIETAKFDININNGHDCRCQRSRFLFTILSFVLF